MYVSTLGIPISGHGHMISRFPRASLPDRPIVLPGVREASRNGNTTRAALRPVHNPGCAGAGLTWRGKAQSSKNPDEKLNDARLYPLLKQMEDEGLITRETVDMAAGPSRKVINITPRGEQALDDWLSSDAGETYSRAPRYDYFRALPFLVKFSHFYSLDPARVVEKLEYQLRHHEAKLVDYRHAREKMIEKGLETCKIQSIEFGVMLEETALLWLGDVKDHYVKQARSAKKAGRKAMTGRR